MEVPVARMEDVPDAEAVRLRQRLDPPQHARELRARNDAVLHVVVGGQAAHGRERRLAALPEERARWLVLRETKLEGAALEADPLDGLGVLLDL